MRTTIGTALASVIPGETVWVLANRPAWMGPDVRWLLRVGSVVRAGDLVAIDGGDFVHPAEAGGQSPATALARARAPLVDPDPLRRVRFPED